MLADQYPIGSHVAFVEGLTFVVVGYDDVGLLDRLIVKQAGVPSTGNFVESCVSPEFVKAISSQEEPALLVNAGSRRLELLAALEDFLLQVIRGTPVPTMEALESKARTILTLTQARSQLAGAAL